MMAPKDFLPPGSEMKNNANHGIGSNLNQGYTLSYRCGNYCTTVTFDDRDCSSVVSSMASFLLGCSFSPSNVIDCMAEVSENLDSAWSGPEAEIDPEIARKWNLFESSQNA
jgi:hypothetical protein